MHSSRDTVTRKFRRANDDEITKSIKFKRTHLDNLLKENSQFKGVIDTFKKKDIQETSVLKDIQSLYDQLRTFELQEDKEVKKNAVLKELIGYLEDQQIRGKKQEEILSYAMKASQEKQLKKQEYDVEQILQRSNEEVAKISGFREQVAVSRSERVVYSNMFKKLEKEIRSYEEEFKDLLLLSSELQAKKEERVLDTPRNVKKKVQKHLVISEEEPDRIENGIEKFPMLTSRKKKSYYTHTRPSSKEDQRSKEPTMEESQPYTLFLQSLLIEFQCDTHNNLIMLLENIEGTNSQLHTTIGDLSVEELNAEYQLSCLRKKAGQVDLSCDNEIETIHLQPSTATNQLQLEFQSQIGGYEKVLLDMASLLNIDVSQPYQINDIFMDIDRRLNTFAPMHVSHISKFDQEELQTQKREETEHQIEGILDRLQKHTESERVFHKEVFREEYTKETTKIKKITKPRR